MTFICECDENCCIVQPCFIESVAQASTMSKSKMYNFRCIVLYFAPYVSLFPWCPGYRPWSSHPAMSRPRPRICQVLFSSCVALTDTTQMVQLASAHGGGAAAACGESHHLFFSLQLPFVRPRSTSVTPGDSVRLLHSPPLSPPLCPAVCLRRRSSHASVCCPDAANQPCKEYSPTSWKRHFSSTQVGSRFLMLSHLLPKPHQCRSFAGCCECQ